MRINPSNDFHVLDQIEAYVSAGLTPAEREAFEAHVAECAACAAALGEARSQDAVLRDLFKDVRPSAGMEDRVIQRVRLSSAPRQPLVHPMVRRAGLGVAAAVALTAGGYAFSQFAESGTLLSRKQAIQHATRFASGVLANSQQANAQQFSRAMGPVYYGELDGRGRTKSVEQLEKAAKDLAAQNKFGDAAAVTNEILRADPGNTFGYYAKDQYNLQANLWGLQQQANGAAAVGARPANSNSAAGGMSGGGGGAGFNDGVALGTERGGSDDASKLGGGFGGARGFGVDKQLGINGQGLAYKPADQLAELKKLPPPGAVVAAGITAAPADQKAGKSTEQRDLRERPANGPVDQLDNILKPTADGKPGEGQQGQSASPQRAAAPVDNPITAGRKVIRNGEMEFEVASFDEATARITKLVDEQGGYVGTTDSDKLPNGKTRGTVTVRVPPEHLDSLILMLRGIGELKSQKIGAQDVTKHYTDLESELKAAHAMQDRLLDIIKNGKGAIKDLLEAEKQLGTWREKIEQIEGEKRYLDNLIGLSTLSITLTEKDIQTPASASQTEQVTMSLETEGVEEAYAKAREALEAAKGRILQSELKQYDAGQYGATIRAAVPPDAAEALIGRLKQLAGRVAHFSRERSETAANTNAATHGPLTVKREDVILALQIYNLANIAPRRTTTLTIAAPNVEKAYQQVLDQVKSVGGRVITSGLTRPKADQATGSLTLQVPSDKGDALLALIRNNGEVMRQESVENPDTQNVTEAKRGVVITLVSLAAQPARESRDVKLAAGNVAEAFAQIMEAAKAADARILSSELNEQNPQDVVGTVALEVPRSSEASFNSAMNKSAQVLTRTVTRSPDVENTVDTKIHLALRIGGAAALPPRQTVTERIEVSDVQRAVDDLLAAAVAAGGREVGNSGVSEDHPGQMSAQVVIDVPLNKAGPILDQLERNGYRRGKQVAIDASVPEGALSRARIDVKFSNSATALGGEETTWDKVRHALSISGQGLGVSLQFLVIGLCLVAPWALVLWFIWRVVRRRKTAVAAVQA